MYIFKQSTDREHLQFKRELKNLTASTGTHDPNLASFHHALVEGHDEGEEFVEYALLTPDGQLAGRAEVNYQPQEPDIGGYGDLAQQLWRNERMGVLTGAFVFPAYRGRGLQKIMIEKRADLLLQAGYSYIVCGVRQGNARSAHNCQKIGMRKVGEKTVRWHDDSQAKVVLYGAHPKEVLH